MAHIKKDCLVKKTTPKKAEQEHLIQDDKLGPKPIPFGVMHDDWVLFKSKIKKGDELWEYSIPPQGLWESKGLCIVRDGKIVNYIETDNIDNYEPENGVFVDSYGLHFLECQTIIKDSITSYMLWVRLEDYGKFIIDEDAYQKSDFFHSDGWDFLSANEVNEDIERTLEDLADNGALNKGVTIIATTATVLRNKIQLKNIKIINGLQMTKMIYRHFNDDSTTSQDRNLFVQIIVTPDAETRNRIIETTSHQDQPVTIDDLQAISNARNLAHRALKIPVECGFIRKP
jgi:hypothetical protein